jgi:hypothetical protein
MERIAFIGGFDKTDMTLLIARTLTLMKFKVLVVDTTVQQKTRYVVPVMKPDVSYVATYFDVDVACGFKTMQELNSYYTQNGIPFQYDYILFDIDTLYYYMSFNISGQEKQFFVTGFDTYSLRRGLSCFSRLLQPVHVQKVYFTKYMIQEEDDYLNYISKDYKIDWDKEIVFYPFETADLDANFVNQRNQKLRLTGLSTPYCDSIGYMAELITKKSTGDVKKAMKQMMN